MIYIGKTTLCISFLEYNNCGEDDQIFDSKERAVWIINSLILPLKTMLKKRREIK